MQAKKVIKKNRSGEIVAIFPSASVAMREDGIPESTFHQGVRQHGILSRGDYTYEFAEGEKKGVYRAPTVTLCWDCARACGGPKGCSWSREYKPVEGWDAERRDVAVWRGDSGRQYTEYAESYVVNHCPEFVPDRRKGKR